MNIPRLEQEISSFDFLTDWLPNNVFKPEPKRLRMQWWGVGNNTGEAIGELRNLLNTEMIPECGTVGCVGGWTELVLTGRIQGGDSFARYALGLTYKQGDELFFGNICNDRNQGTPEHVENVIKHLYEFANRYKEQLQAHIVEPEVELR